MTCCSILNFNNVTIWSEWSFDLGAYFFAGIDVFENNLFKSWEMFMSLALIKSYLFEEIVETIGGVKHVLFVI